MGKDGKQNTGEEDSDSGASCSSSIIGVGEGGGGDSNNPYDAATDKLEKLRLMTFVG